MPILSSRFSTVELPDSVERDLWNEATKGVYDPLPLGAERLDATIESWNLGGVMMSHCVVQPTVVRRSRGTALNSGIDHYVLHHSWSGGHRRRIGDAEASVDTGDIVFADLGQTLETQLTGRGCVLVTIPRDVLDPLLPRAARGNLHGLHLRKGTAMCDLLAGHIRQLRHRVSEFEPPEVGYVGNATLQLLAGTIAGQQFDEESAAQRFPTDTLERIKAFIEANLDHPDLGPDFLARRFRLSRSTLYELFRTTEGIASWIVTRRLRRCLLDLGDPRQRHRRISEIAYSWGFTSDAHFSRAFRRAFGLSPGEARAAAFLGTSGKPGDDSDMSPDRQAARQLGAWLRSLGGTLPG